MLSWVIVNILVSAFFALSIRSVLMRAYLAINYLVLLNPLVMWFLFDASHPKFTPQNPTNETALIYILLFNIILCLSYLLFMKVIPGSQLVRGLILKHKANNLRNVNIVVLLVLVLAIVGYGGKMVLDHFGAFRMLGQFTYGEGVLQMMKQISIFDLLAIIFLGELRLRLYRSTWLLRFALLILLASSLLFAFWSGSRGQVVVVILLGMIAYRDIIRRHIFIFMLSMSLLLPMVFYIFPLLSFYRGYGYDFETAMSMFRMMEEDRFEVALDVIITRFNYFAALVRAIEHVEYNGAAGGMVYWNNLFGLIPRMIWESKPLISNDSQLLAHELGLVSSVDNNTSVGLRVIGESFYELAWLGVLVACFQALLFVIIQKNTYCPGSRVAMTIYTYMILYILQRDGYFAVIPGLALQMIGIIIFFGAMAIFLAASTTRRVRMKEVNEKDYGGRRTTLHISSR